MPAAGREQGGQGFLLGSQAPSGGSVFKVSRPCVRGLACLADQVHASEVLVRSRAARFSASAGSRASARSRAIGQVRPSGTHERRALRGLSSARWRCKFRIASGSPVAHLQGAAAEKLDRREHRHNRCRGRPSFGSGHRPRRRLRRFSGPIPSGPASREAAGAPRRKNTPPLSRTRVLNRTHEASGCALSQGTAQEASALCTRRLFYCAIRPERQLNFVVPAQKIARSSKNHSRRGSTTL